MPVNNKIIAPYIIRLYMWELLQANGNLEKIRDFIPIVPLNDEPDLSDSGKNYLIYGYSENYRGSLPEIRTGIFAVRVTANTYAELSGITNTISRAFETRDVAAANVNLWSSKYSSGQFVGIRFTDLDITYIENGDAALAEGGKSETTINISYNYITQQVVKTFNGTTWA